MRISLLTNPLVWLIGQGAVLLGLCLVSDAFDLFPLDIDGYWMTLQEMSYNDLHEILSNVRTVGYPLFLKMVTLVSPRLEALPFFQILIRVLAVLVFYVGLRSFGIRGWLALVMASLLLYENAILSWDFCLRVTQVLTDAVGESLVILSAGMLLLVLSRPASVTAWTGLTIGLFVTYQIRPLNQFLIVLFPVVGTVLLALRSPWPDWLRLRWRVGLGLCGACLLPFLAWCTFRLVMVGHFGLVSFTGNTLGGVAGQILAGHLHAGEVLADVDEEQQPFARAVLARRKDIWDKKIHPAFGPWKPTFDESGRINPHIVDDNHVYVFAQIDLFQEVAEDWYGHDNVTRDRAQLAAALAIIRARPWYYAQWIWESLRYAPQKVLGWNVVLSVLVAVMVVLASLWYLLYLWRWLTRGSEAVRTRPRPVDSLTWEFHVLALLGFSFTLCQVLLVAALVGFLPRYFDTAGVFLPCVAVIVIVSLGQHVWALLQPWDKSAD